MISWIFPSNKGLTALQRGARWIATACSREDNGVLVATPGGPPWSEIGQEK